MLVNILPGQPLKSVTDAGSSPTPSPEQLAALLGGRTGGGYSFGGNGHSANLCTGGAATASNQYGTWGPARAFDGDASTAWWSTAAAAWIKYQFPAAKKICKVRVYQENFYNGAIKDFTVDGSNDGLSWTTLYTGQAAAANGWQEFAFANAAAYLYARLNITAKWNGDFYIQEIEMMEADAAALRVDVDITGGGTWPVAEARYYTTETAAENVAIRTSSDGTTWTAHDVLWPGGTYLKAAIGTTVRYVKVEHTPASAHTAYGIEAVTRRPYARTSGRYGLRQPGRAYFHAKYNAGWASPVAPFFSASYNNRALSRNSRRAGWHITQPCRVLAPAAYNVLQKAAPSVTADYHVRPPAVRWRIPSSGTTPDMLEAGVLRTGTEFGDFALHLENDMDGTEGALKMGGVRITASLVDGNYTGGGAFAGQEAVNRRWLSVKSAGTSGVGITDDAQAAFTPVGGDPENGGVAISDIPAGTARHLQFRIGIPADTATLSRTIPRLAVSYTALAQPGHGGGHGEYFGG